MFDVNIGRYVLIGRCCPGVAEYQGKNDTSDGDHVCLVGVNEMCWSMDKTHSQRIKMIQFNFEREKSRSHLYLFQGDAVKTDSHRISETNDVPIVVVWSNVELFVINCLQYESDDVFPCNRRRRRRMSRVSLGPLGCYIISVAHHRVPVGCRQNGMGEEYDTLWMQSSKKSVQTKV